jgi:aspartate racemase
MESGKTVGILGGMGPMATVEFFRRLVTATPAETDQEHLRILIDNDPRVPNRTDAIFNRGPSPVPRLQAMARRLETAGADLLVMPCNTAHAHIEEIRASVSIPVLDMIREAVATVGQAAVGLLATDGTIRARLYQEACETRGIRLVAPDSVDQGLVMGAIERIKRGVSPRHIERDLEPIVRRLEGEGAEAIIAGCTEISLVPGDAMSIPWIDALDRLVEATLREARPGIGLGNGKEVE